MPHITVNPALPGIVGLFDYRPETARPLSELAEILLRGPSTLTRGERELIAAVVSRGNDCVFCASAHEAFAAAQIEGGMSTVEQATRDYEKAPISGKLKALLKIALLTRDDGRKVDAVSVAAAKAAGASETEIHDTVLIAAAFCMFNRYVDGLATQMPASPASFAERAKRVVEHGYVEVE
ncbi:carboxymuconolactone decarboxylase [Amycolatopsis rhizosphaerae]|uniref:Carboxymuconolactone decarboxylase n=1 Tax=Amycolatopsis rhizosphaerae TaxID=2053003 RepID=A0A558CB01_9PSEU|nr:carboxymuconolactone decarboxylase family protein [Amycolatopsis rhizosphaerae]TVT45966.1 carboxymuconolactone decarboxylase [Amycolatopsis rhizosphaerae]